MRLLREAYRCVTCEGFYVALTLLRRVMDREGNEAGGGCEREQQDILSPTRPRVA